MKTVNEVSKIAGISIRTLQYYDKIGLLKPTAYSEAGYRLYSDDDLKMLQSILLYRELEFPLKEIKELINSENFNKGLALELRLKKWCKAISFLPSCLHYATSLQTLKSLSITCKRWSIVSCVHDSLLGHSSKRRECLSMKCVATNHSSF